MSVRSILEHEPRHETSGRTEGAPVVPTPTLMAPADTRGTPVAPPLPRLKKQPGASTAVPAASSAKEVKKVVKHEIQDDAQHAKELEQAMRAQRALSDAKIAAMWADVETEMMRIWEEVLQRREKVMSELFDKWIKVLMG
jgi:hypothetical protein